MFKCHLNICFTIGTIKQLRVCSQLNNLLQNLHLWSAEPCMGRPCKALQFINVNLQFKIENFNCKNVGSALYLCLRSVPVCNDGSMMAANFDLCGTILTDFGNV